MHLRRAPFLLALILATLGLPLAAASGTVTNPAGFEIHRGVNLSHWLSQCPRGLDQDTFITERDIAFIRSIGYDHVRLPVDEVQLWNSDGTRIEPAFHLLTTALDWCLKRHLRVIVDLHSVRSHDFNAPAGQNRLWTDPAAQARFLHLWADLSSVLRQYPDSDVAYEILNEPVADDPEQWNALLAKAYAEIRAREPNRVLVIGSNKWQQAASFPALKVPAGDPNIILSVHDYEPFAFTHHLASWTHLRAYRGPVHYPGPTFTPAELAANVDPNNKELLDQLRPYTTPWNPRRMLQVLEPAIARARALHLQLYCGEFGCLPTVPRTDRLAWYRDMVRVLEQNGVAWANWEYKADFGIVPFDVRHQYQPQPADMGLVQALLGAAAPGRSG